MAVMREWRCMFHGPFDATESTCDACGHDEFVSQEIRTAPAFKSKRTTVADQILRGIAQDAGLTDLKNDPKGGVSVLQALQKTNDVSTPRWMEVPHAAPGEKPAVFAPPGFVASAEAASTVKTLPKSQGGRFNNALAKSVIHGEYKG